MMEVRIPAGGRVVAISDLHLPPRRSNVSARCCTMLAARLAELAGPVTVVLAGDIIELLGFPEATAAEILREHEDLCAALAGVTARGGRVVYIVGNHDGDLAWDVKTADTVREMTGAELALAANVVLPDGGRIRVEHGHQLDPYNCFHDPRNNLDTPLGHHIVREILPRIEFLGRGWLDGAHEMADPADFPSFVGSRLVYRKLIRHAWWLLLIPVLLLLGLRVSEIVELQTRYPDTTPWVHGAQILGYGAVADLIVVAAIIAIVSRRAWTSISALALAERGYGQNKAARQRAADLTSEGYLGYLSGHTHHPELSGCGDGFYANTGSCTTVVEATATRLGMPTAYLRAQQISWLELTSPGAEPEAGPGGRAGWASRAGCGPSCGRPGSICPGPRGWSGSEPTDGSGLPPRRPWWARGPAARPFPALIRPVVVQVTVPARRPGDNAHRLASVSTAPAVEVASLVKRYRHALAVDGLTLTAARGEVTSILGPNGAGKTSTIEICEGYRRADAGTVRVLGLDPARDTRALRPRVGVMLQAGGVPPAIPAGEYLRLLARFHAHPLDPAALLSRVGLTEVARTPYKRLSGGQQQRLALAAAVIGRPELVFLDEPTAGMDPQARHATWDLITELRAAGVSVILTTHFMDEAERLSDRVAIIDRGRLVAGGTPAELCGGAGQLRFRAETGLDTDGLLAALPDGSAAKESPAGHYVIEVPDGVTPQLLASVTAWCAEHSVLPTSLRIESRTLEDVFLELTGRELRS